MKLVQLGNSVECQKSNIALRSSGDNPFGIEYEGVRYFKYKSKKRAIVTITEELNPKEPRICKTSYLDLNGILEAEVIEIWTEKRVKFEVTSNFSNVHGIQQNSVNAFTFAKIVITWRAILEKALTI